MIVSFHGVYVLRFGHPVLHLMYRDECCMYAPTTAAKNHCSCGPRRTTEEAAIQYRSTFLAIVNTDFVVVALALRA